MRLERQLMLRLAATAEIRDAASSRIRELATSIDWTAFAGLLETQRLLPLLGTRLAQSLENDLPASFASLLAQATGRAGRRALVLEAVSARAVSALGQAGIPALALKGAALSGAIYGDPGLRISEDVDLLVARRHLRRAVEAITDHGYSPPTDAPRTKGLPLLHYTLRPRDGWRPRIDLHWRIHWYERDFSEQLLSASTVGSGGVRQAALGDELAALCLFYQRDGFTGLRYATDIAGWWDAHGAECTSPVLDPIVHRYPHLRWGLEAAALAVNRLVGVPIEGLLFEPPSSPRPRLASMLANWSLDADRRHIDANLILIDGLLAPRGTRWEFMRRQVIPGPAVITDYYNLPETARLRRDFWRMAHPPKLLIRSLATLWRIRAGGGSCKCGPA